MAPADSTEITDLVGCSAALAQPTLTSSAPVIASDSLAKCASEHDWRSWESSDLAPVFIRSTPMGTRAATFSDAVTDGLQASPPFVNNSEMQSGADYAPAGAAAEPARVELPYLLGCGRMPREYPARVPCKGGVWGFNDLPVDGGSGIQGRTVDDASVSLEYLHLLPDGLLDHASNMPGAALDASRIPWGISAASPNQFEDASWACAAPYVIPFAELDILDNRQPVSPAIPTIGSSKHFLGTCKPCAFANTKGCKDGSECNFCHLCGPGEKKRRKKEKRLFRTINQRGAEYVPFPW